MTFNYQNNGDILYGIETFRFRYNTDNEVATVTLYDLIDDKQFAYDIKMTNKKVPEQLRSLSSTDYELFKKFPNVEFQSFFKNKNEALQNAIDIMSEVMNFVNQDN